MADPIRNRLSTLLMLVLVALAVIGLVGLASKNEGTATLFGIVCCMPLVMFGGPLLLIFAVMRVARWWRERRD